LFVSAHVWARWPDAAKHATITVDQSISYRQFFSACLHLTSDPSTLARLKHALSSTEQLRQFAGELLWQVWCKNNDPRAHVLRTLVREELSNYRREYR
ncbi:MAG TPA: hypothetical protein VFA72_16830, partial [Burkholderiales bacterium]|nr:hypothetical protein [Burkholderiales bacterium]